MEDFDKKIGDILFDGVEQKPMTYIAIVLDSSASMHKIANEIIGGFNSQLELFKEKSKETPVKLSVVTFDTNVRPVMWDKEPNSVLKLSENTYVPTGMTALCDAVGDVISHYSTIAEDDKEAAFLIVIMSDGEENASQRYTTTRIKELITKYTDTTMWTFTYLGANQNMWEISETFGIAKGNTMAFSATKAGVNEAYTNQNSAFDGYLTSRGISGSTGPHGVGGTTTFTNTKNFYYEQT